MITNSATGTNLHEIADGIYRINTPLDIPGGAFNFNQYLILDDEPLLFHTGLRQMFALVAEAIAHVMPLQRLRKTTARAGWRAGSQTRHQRILNPVVAYGRSYIAQCIGPLWQAGELPQLQRVLVEGSVPLSI